jgi:hypothetical protein
VTPKKDLCRLLTGCQKSIVNCDARVTGRIQRRPDTVLGFLPIQALVKMQDLYSHIHILSRIRRCDEEAAFGLLKLFDVTPNGRGLATVSDSSD